MDLLVNPTCTNKGYTTHFCRDCGYYYSDNALERLKEKGYIEKADRKVALTEKGKEILNEYMTIIDFISAHLALRCGTPRERAYDDALNATCAFSDETRNGVARFIRAGMPGAYREQKIM